MIRAAVIDDEQVVRDLLCHVLRRRGYEVASFPNPFARHCSRSGDLSCPQPENQPCVDIILTDLEMPGHNGLNYVETQLRNGCRCKHIALITGSGTEADLSRARRLGIKTFLKPFDIKDLDAWLAEVEAALRRSASPEV